MKTKKNTVKKEKKQVVEIHIYIHQSNPNSGGSGQGTFYYQCTWPCSSIKSTFGQRQQGTTSTPYIVTSMGFKINSKQEDAELLAKK